MPSPTYTSFPYSSNMAIMTVVMIVGKTYVYGIYQEMIMGNTLFFKYIRISIFIYIPLSPAADLNGKSVSRESIPITVYMNNTIGCRVPGYHPLKLGQALFFPSGTHFHAGCRCGSLAVFRARAPSAGFDGTGFFAACSGDF